MRKGLAAGLALAAAWWPAMAAAGQLTHAPPSRIVSLNLCAEQILIDLVPRKRIAAVSHLAADPTVSAVASKAKGIAVTRGEAESVLAFDPDLVLAGAFSTPATVSILERVGRRVVKVPMANDLDGIRKAVRIIAAAVGERPQGEAMIRRLEQRLAAAVADAGDESTRPAALVYQVNGLSSGIGSLGDAVLRWAGFANHAGRIGLGPGDQVALEHLAADPPDLLVLTGPSDEYRTVVAENLRHPVVRQVTAEQRAVLVPWRHWLCGTPHVADAVERLAAERRTLAPARRLP